MTGTQRFYCPRCRKSFSSYQKKSGRRKSDLLWLEKYLLEGITYQSLSKWSGFSKQTLLFKFHQLLQQEPPLVPGSLPQTEEAYLLIDGLWFGKKYCLMLYRHSQHKRLLHASFMFKEYGSLIKKDLEFLLNQGYRFTGVVSDGGTGIKKAVWEVLGHMPHQICLAHLHRDAVNALGKYPKDPRVKQLKKLTDHVWLIESKEALQWWKQELTEWTSKNQDFLQESRHVEGFGWWFIHKGLRKAVRILVSLPDTSFRFLDHPLMPKTTNQLEGSISVLSRKKEIHKGLKRERVKPFLKWFIFFYNQKLLSQSKT